MAIQSFDNKKLFVPPHKSAKFGLSHLSRELKKLHMKTTSYMFNILDCSRIGNDEVTFLLEYNLLHSTIVTIMTTEYVMKYEEIHKEAK